MTSNLNPSRFHARDASRSINLATIPVIGVKLRLMAGVVDPDAALMTRVKQGDMEAFAELVEKYKQKVANLIFRTLPDATEAEDLTQVVFIQVWKSAERYRVEAKFSTWLFTIARNLCLNEIRRRNRHPADSLDAATAEREEQPGRQFTDFREVSPPIYSYVTSCKPRCRKFYKPCQKTNAQPLLFKEEEMSYEAISEVLGCSLSATKSLIHRARETLKDKLKPYLNTGEWP